MGFARLALVILSAHLLLVACGKDSQKERRKVIFSIDKGLFAATGGVMIWGKTTEGQTENMALAFLEPSGAGNIQVDLVSGKWEFAAMAWYNPPAPGPLYGPTACITVPAVDLSGDDVKNVNIAIASGTNDCTGAAHDPVFGGTLINNTWEHLKIQSCNGLTGVAADNECNTPLSRLGENKGFMVEMMSFDPVTGTPQPGIRSFCVGPTQSNSTLVADFVNIPVGGGQFPIPTKIIVFHDPSCFEPAGEYFFPNGIANGAVGKDTLFFPASILPMPGPRVVLASGISGSGFSPLDAVLPSWDCDNYPSTFTYCGPGVIETYGTQGTPWLYALPFDTAIPQLLHFPGTNCTGVNASGTFLDSVNNCACDASFGLCEVEITGAAGSSFGAGVTPAQRSTFFDGATTASVMMLDAFGFAFLDARDSLYRIYGSPDGFFYQLLDAFQFGSSTTFGPPDEFQGVFARIRRFLGPEQAGGVLFKSGLQSCAALPTTGETQVITFSEGDEEISMEVSISNGTTIIPHMFYGNTVADQNTGNAKYSRRIVIGLEGSKPGNSGDEEETFVVEFNCPGAAGGDFTGYFAVKGERHEPHIEQIRKQLGLIFWNTNLVTQKRVEIARVGEELDEGNNLERKSWRLIRVVSENASASTTTGWSTKVEYDAGEPGFYNQTRSMFRFQSIAVANTPYDAGLYLDGANIRGNSYTNNEDLGVGVGAQCVSLGVLLPSNPAATCPLIGTIFYLDGTHSPLIHGPINPVMDPMGRFTMDWVGRPISGGTNPVSMMESVMESFIP